MKQTKYYFTTNPNPNIPHSINFFVHFVVDCGTLAWFGLAIILYVELSLLGAKFRVTFDLGSKNVMELSTPGSESVFALSQKQQSKYNTIHNIHVEGLNAWLHLCNTYS